MHKILRLAVGAIMIVGILVAGGIGAGTVYAQSAGNGIKVSPVRSDLTIKPGESRTLTLTVQNITTTDADFQAITNDFVANGEEGQPALILDANKFAPSHSLKRYMASIPNLQIPAGQTRSVKVTINIPKDASGGGYYGAVRFAPAGTDTGGNNVVLSASVGSIILVEVPGDIKEDTRIESFDVRRGAKGVDGSSLFFTSKDLHAVVRFKNYGNTHEQPFGKVRLLKNGKVLQETEINKTNPKGNVLPNSIRRFNVELTKVGAFGKYTVQGNFGYGTNGQLLSASTSFWVVPLTLIGMVLGGLVVLLLLIFGLPRAIRRYNQSVLRKAGRR